MDSSQQIKSISSNPAASTSKKLPFTSRERELIVELVRDRPIIEDKKTNAKNIDLKKQAWEELTVVFNAQQFVQKRSSHQLKRCWENIKTQRKKELSQITNNLKKTGGSPPLGGSSTSDNMVDIHIPFINLMVPGEIDSNSIEISGDLKKIEEETVYIEKDDDLNNGLLGEPIKKKRKFTDIPRSSSNSEGNKISNKVNARIKRCNLNIDQDEALHQLRIQRETILIRREENQLLFEAEMHKLQVEKIKLEIEILKQNKEK